MPENSAPVPIVSNWPQALVVVFGMIQTSFLIYLTAIGNQTHDNTKEVQQEQTQVKKTLQKSAAQQWHERGLRLWTDAQYLKELAEHTDATPQDKAKAAEAKKLYDEFMKRPRPQPPADDGD